MEVVVAAPPPRGASGRQSRKRADQEQVRDWLSSTQFRDLSMPKPRNRECVAAPAQREHAGAPPRYRPRNGARSGRAPDRPRARSRRGHRVPRHHPSCRWPRPHGVRGLRQDHGAPSVLPARQRLEAHAPPPAAASRFTEARCPMAQLPLQRQRTIDTPPQSDAVRRDSKRRKLPPRNRHPRRGAASLARVRPGR